MTTEKADTTKNEADDNQAAMSEADIKEFKSMIKAQIIQEMKDDRKIAMEE